MLYVKSPLMNATKFLAALCAIALPLHGADEPGGNAPPAKPEHVRKVEKAPDFVRATADPLMGDWQGEGGLVAQIFLTSGGKYQANLLTAFDAPNNVIAVLQGPAPGEAITFGGDGWSGIIEHSHFTGSKGDKHFDLQPIVRTSPTLGAKPPKDAVVLFDGSNLEAWAKKNGKDWLAESGPVPWKLLSDGTLEIVPTTESIITHQKFGDCHLHVEFRTIGFPSKSAVFLQTRYEININETYGHTEGNMTGGMDNTAKGRLHRVCGRRCHRWRGKHSTSISALHASTPAAKNRNARK